MYWEDRYRRGATSGPGSAGWEKRWKWRQISRYAGVLDHVLDVGCGDLGFWEGHDCSDYVGIDVSPYIQARNAKLRPNWSFLVLDATKAAIPVRKRVVFCFDVVFHVLPEDEFGFLIKNLVASTEEWLFLSNWGYNPLPEGKTTDGVYQVYRDIGNYLPLFEPLRPVRVHARFNRWKVFYAFHRS